MVKTSEMMSEILSVMVSGRPKAIAEVEVCHPHQLRYTFATLTAYEI